MMNLDIQTPQPSWHTEPLDHRGMPLCVERQGEERALRSHLHLLQQKLKEHGALLLRGFDVETASAFQGVAELFTQELGDEYLGVTPRTSIAGKIKTATELGGHYLVPQHLELSFLQDTPRYLFFCCFELADSGGETTLCDFRRVYQQMDPAIRERFERRGLRLVRNYDGPNTRWSWDPLKTKRWHEMFDTEDRGVVEDKAARAGLRVTWRGDDRLRLTNEHPPVRVHPDTGEPVWFNHLTVFHASVAEGEYRRLFARTGALSAALLAEGGGLLRRLRREDPEDFPTQYFYADGSVIPDEDVEHVRDIIWHNTVSVAWQRGDVLVIDNHAVSHGRFPFRGRRSIGVTWGW